ncbi:HTH domain-containing protein [Gilliamella mensalis]|uniref:HTH domain-containing protein n=1 Tax=Gilliamella mensalis TaxID=1908520 RepID=UPI000A147090|nr:HTH domain-containing protein [Gilliamella mensalis]
MNHKERITVTDLAKRFMVSRLTIYNVLKKARLKLFVPLTSKGKRYKTISYQSKYLVKVKKSIEDKLRQQAN